MTSSRVAKFAVLIRGLMLLFLLLHGTAYSGDGGQQGRRRGFSIDQESYSRVPFATPLMRGSVDDSLPRNFSLKRYMPTPGDQEDHPTNAAWAVAYSAYTCIKALEHNSTDPVTINAMALSPGYLYVVALGESRPGCESGVSLTDALDAMASKGTVSLRDFPGECDKVPPEGLKVRASENRISAYRRLFGEQSERKEHPLKECLARKKPVVAALWYVSSFDGAGEVWTPGREESYRGFGIQDSGVAVTVVGYDDNRYGGAFEVMNSQGTGWGEGGFCWIKYGIFNRFCVQAFEMIVDPSIGPSDEVRLPDAVVPPSPSEATIAGSVNFVDLYQRQISVSRSGETYQVNGSEISGSKFRIQIGATTACYVYLIASDDQSQRTSTIFPDARFHRDEKLMSGGQIVIPPLGLGYIQLDATAGVDHFCFLFSVRRLDVADLTRRIDGEKGDFIARVKAALSGESVSPQDVTYSDYAGPAFWTAERKRTVATMFVDMQHQQR